MEILNYLEDWKDLYSERTIFRNNIDQIAIYLLSRKNNNKINIVATRRSGAMIMGALMMKYPANYILLPNNFDTVEDKKALNHLQFLPSEIVIVDDHICGGSTLSRIKQMLEYKKVDNQVFGIIMNEWKGCDFWYDKNKRDILENFPTTKFWMH